MGGPVHLHRGSLLPAAQHRPAGPQPLHRAVRGDHGDVHQPVVGVRVGEQPGSAGQPPDVGGQDRTGAPVQGGAVVQDDLDRHRPVGDVPHGIYHVGERAHLPTSAGGGRPGPSRRRARARTVPSPPPKTTSAPSATNSVATNEELLRLDQDVHRPATLRRHRRPAPLRRNVIETSTTSFRLAHTRA